MMIQEGGERNVTRTLIGEYKDVYRAVMASLSELSVIRTAHCGLCAIGSPPVTELSKGKRKKQVIKGR